MKHLVMSLALSFLLAGSATGTPTLTLVHPGTVSVGSLFQVKLHANSEFVDFAGYQFTFEFDPNVLSLVSIDSHPTFAASYGITEICLSLGSGEVPPGEAKERGALCNICAAGAVDGEGDLATITFSADAVGTSPLAFTFTNVVERDCCCLWTLHEIPHVAENSSVTVVSGPGCM